MRAMQDLEKFPNITLEDFESFSVESIWGGNAGNAGLGKNSKKLQHKILRQISKELLKGI